MSESALKLFFIIIGLLLSHFTFAQQDPYYTHFRFNQPAYNPAGIGDKDSSIGLSAVYHSQWKSTDDQSSLYQNIAPITINFNIDGQILSKKHHRPRGAMGVSVTDDYLGYLKTTNMNLQGAYFLNLDGGNSRIVLGSEIGLIQFGYVRGDSFPSASDQTLDIGIGIMLRQKRLTSTINDFYLGVSMKHLNTPVFELRFDTSRSSLWEYRPAFYLTGGAEIITSKPELTIEPAVLFKYAGKFQMHLNVMAKYNNTFRGGLGYRQFGTTDAMSLMLGYIRGGIQIGYSYDVALSRSRTVSSGTHEIMIAYDFRFM